MTPMFGISAAQASGDLQAYQKTIPGTLIYHMSRERYEGTEGMGCARHEPRLEEAMAAFLGGRLRPAAGERVEGAAAPRRAALAMDYGRCCGCRRRTNGCRGMLCGWESVGPLRGRAE